MLKSYISQTGVNMNKINWKLESVKVYELSIQGSTLKEIGDIYGVTRERIRQVLSTYYPTLTKELRGKMLSAAKQRKNMLEERFARTGRYTGRHADDLSRAIMECFRRKRQNAKVSKWGWDLSYHDIEWNMVCPVLGMDLDWFAERKQENSPSFDRINPKLGYVKGNVQIISARANRIKNDGLAEEHRLIADYMDKHLI
jgi:hypothetical protein